MSRYTDSNSRLVYSTEKGRMCPECGKPSDQCRCGRKKAASPGDGIVRISRETKGRKGKGVTLITGTGLEPPELKQLAKRLKARCGSGGTVKNGVIEIQGDHRGLLEEQLKKEGFTVKRSGG
ncbi:MAG: translation initiation factor Sui1 [Desulfobacteraceae bacterium]|nr:translation initiation factor Sui1 [Desulfobacteraceae bacterium]